MDKKTPFLWGTRSDAAALHSSSFEVCRSGVRRTRVPARSHAFARTTNAKMPLLLRIRTRYALLRFSTSHPFPLPRVAPSHATRDRSEEPWIDRPRHPRNASGWDGASPGGRRMHAEPAPRHHPVQVRHPQRRPDALLQQGLLTSKDPSSFDDLAPGRRNDGSPRRLGVEHGSIVYCLYSVAREPTPTMAAQHRSELKGGKMTVETMIAAEPHRASETLTAHLSRLTRTPRIVPGVRQRHPRIQSDAFRLDVRKCGRVRRGDGARGVRARTGRFRGFVRSGGERGEASAAAMPSGWA